MPAFARQFNGLAQVALPARPLHLAIGMFDGVHLGHRAVIDAAIQSARRSSGLAGAFTLWPHPSALLNPSQPVRLIAGPELRARLLGEAGLDFVITQPFTPEFAAVEAEEFLPLLKQHLPALSAIYVGENWRYGRGRRGDIAKLIADARHHHLSVMSAQRINHNGEPISSTRIRECLRRGEIEEANTLLGYTYFSEGIVTPGKQLGRALGFPTLNVPWTPALQPRLGVYAVRVSSETFLAPYPAVANYGLRPTVEDAVQARLEIHVLGDCPFGKGDAVRIEWLKFFRPEQKFSDLTQLRAQIARDREAVLAFFRT
jgi:riboflavin kinase/FMN adenylyltransferase